MENKSPLDNEYLTPNDLEHQTRAEIINQEQPVIDDVEIVNNPNAPQSILKPEIQEQYDQAKEPSEELLKMRDYKQRQMEEFTNNYSISQVIPSGWTTFFNVINTIFLTLALIIAFLVAFGLIFGLRIGIVPTKSMEPTISQWSMVIVRPVSGLDEIQVGDIICYKKDKMSYVHRVSGFTPGETDDDVRIIAKGDNPDTNGAYDLVPIRMVEGKLALSIPGLGAFIWFIKDNIFLTIAIVLTVLIAVLLLRSIVERKHAKEEIEIFLTKKAEFERESERKYLEMKKAQENKEFEKIMRTKYGDEESFGGDSGSPQPPQNGLN